MPDIITLKVLCEEMKIDPREARERLRAAVTNAKANLHWQSHASRARRGNG